ncbi:MAG: amidohydrolase family protein [Proteobacteria bacterium]|nr:amidohydrolase family protein [Pseudomonadota bacterium]
MVYILVLSTLALAGSLVEIDAEPKITLIADVHILTSDGTVEGPYDVMLRDGIIEDISDISAPVLADHVVDGTGATLMPGLVDAHVHVDSMPAIPGRLHLPKTRDNFEGWLYSGITTVFDLGSDLDRIESLQRKVDRGKLSGPSVFTTGKCFGAPGGHPASAIEATFHSPLVKLISKSMAWEVETAADVERVQVKRGATGFYKIILDQIPRDVPELSDEALAALRQAATNDSSRVIAHVGRPNDVQRALDTPVDALAHTPYTGLLSEDQVAALASKHIPVIPTLVVWESTYQVALAKPFFGPLEQETLRRRTVRDFEANARGRAPVEGEMALWVEQVVDGRGERWANVRAYIDGGVEILVGSDSPNLGLSAGPSLHREIDLLAEAGMEPADILVAVTWANSRFIDPDARFGAIRPGFEADLLLVDGDPTEDIERVHAIRAVWTDGRYVERRQR